MTMQTSPCFDSGRMADQGFWVFGNTWHPQPPGSQELEKPIIGSFANHGNGRSGLRPGLDFYKKADQRVGSAIPTRQRSTTMISLDKIGSDIAARAGTLSRAMSPSGAGLVSRDIIQDAGNDLQYALLSKVTLCSVQKYLDRQRRLPKAVITSRVLQRVFAGSLLPPELLAAVTGVSRQGREVWISQGAASRIR